MPSSQSVPANLHHREIDEVHRVGTFMATRKLYRSHGPHVGPTSGAAALVDQWYANQNPSASMAVILPDEGASYQQTVYDDAWLSGLSSWPVPQLRSRHLLDQLQEHGESTWAMLNWCRRSPGSRV
jgi:hypothetical protein